MAKKPAATAALKGGKQKKGAFSRILMLSVVVFVGLWFLPTVIFLFIALLPTGAAFIVDRSPNKYEWICVGGLNFAGASPFLVNLWVGRHTVEAAIGQLTDVFNLVTIYGAAGLGWMLYVSLPPVVGAFMQMTAQRRIATLKATQSRLVQQWGPEVGKTKSEGLR